MFSLLYTVKHLLVGRCSGGVSQSMRGVGQGTGSNEVKCKIPCNCFECTRVPSGRVFACALCTCVWGEGAGVFCLCHRRAFPRGEGSVPFFMKHLSSPACGNSCSSERLSTPSFYMPMDFTPPHPILDAPLVAVLPPLPDLLVY